MTRSPAPAVTRAAAVLGLLAESSDPVGLAELARRLGLPKSSLANVCGALVDAGLVRRVDGRYRLGHVVLELGNAYLSSNSLLADFADIATGLPAGSQETLLLAQLDGTDILYLARHDGTQPIRLASDIGRRLPANCTALGKAMLAQLDPDEVAERFRRLPAFPILSAQSKRTIEELLGDLAITRDRGYAVDDEENTPGIRCFGVPILSDPLRAVSVTLLKARATDELERRLVADLHRLASHLGRRSLTGRAAAPRSLSGPAVAPRP
jgi:DNA-binding IclR family transcriptional regulator